MACTSLFSFYLSILFLFLYIFNIVTSVYTFFDILFIQFVWFIQLLLIFYLNISARKFYRNFFILIFQNLTILDSRYPNIFIQTFYLNFKFVSFEVFLGGIFSSFDTFLSNTFMILLAKPLSSSTSKYTYLTHLNELL